MEMTLFTEIVIDSAHQLKGYDGKCSRIHGHSWLLKCWCKGDDKQKDEIGILFDFTNLKKFIGEELDHFIINDKIDVNPTAENISLWIYKKLKEKYPDLQFRVRLYETAVLKETYCERGDF